MMYPVREKRGGRRRAAALVAVAVVVAGCQGPGPPPRTTRPAPDDLVRVVDLNAAMGHRIEAGQPAGTDATEEDYALLADDIVGQRGDIANLQEMALPAARRLREILRDRTGDEWELNWATADTATYHAGRSEDEERDRVYENVPAGNAQLVRIGDGITRQRPVTLDDADDDQGMRLPSGGRSFLGTEITTDSGVVAVYNTHLALARQVSDEQRAADVAFIQETTESRTDPAVIAGDFNEVIDVAPGQPPNRRTAAAIRAFMSEYGYTDVARDEGPTSDQKYRRPHRRIDYILARGVGTRDTVRFVSHQSDHWGLATTLEFRGTTTPPTT
jgi:endonuclease/exonuclease/phosphatase family metal-dependent hydrolase